MSVFEYKGLNAAGKNVTGLKEAESAKALRAALRKDGIFLTDVVGQSDGKMGGKPGAPQSVLSGGDVNHNFAIYAPDGRIAIQTQAMPGYVNKLLYTFHTPGTYKIRCLEYCGIGHDVMTTDIQVVAADGGRS